MDLKFAAKILLWILASVVLLIALGVVYLHFFPLKFGPMSM